MILTSIFLLLPLFSNALDWNTNCSSPCTQGKDEINITLKSNILSTIGAIPAGKTNVKLETNQKINLHLMDKDFPIWEQHEGEFEYKDMFIRYTSMGEGSFIEIIGQVTTTLVVTVFANEDLDLNVFYEWGIGIGQSCLHDDDCKEALICKGEKSSLRNSVKQCHESNWCYSEDTVSKDCGTIGDWTCQSHQCQKKITSRNLANTTKVENKRICGKREGYEVMELSQISINSTGTMVSVTSPIKNSFAACTYMRCLPHVPCCNSCHSGISYDGMYLIPEDGVSPMGCVGNECNYMNNCTYTDGDLVTVYGVIREEGDSILVHDHCKSHNVFD